MGDVIYLDNYVRKSSIIHSIPGSKYKALELINKYLNSNVSELAAVPIVSSSMISNLDFDSRDASFFDKKYYYGFEETKKRNNVRLSPWVQDFMEPYVQQMDRDYSLTMRESIDLAIDLFIQSFVDYYNGIEDNIPSIFFSPAVEEVRRRAMAENEQEVLSNFYPFDSYLLGFSNKGLIMGDQEDLERKILENLLPQL